MSFVLHCCWLHLALLFLPESLDHVDEVLCADIRDLDLDACTVGIVPIGFDHLIATFVDRHVMNIRVSTAIEDQITRFLLAVGNALARVVVPLHGCTVAQRLASALIDSILAQTRAVKADHIGVVAVWFFRLLFAVCRAVVVATSPRVRILANHTVRCRHDFVATTRSRCRRATFAADE